MSIRAVHVFLAAALFGFLFSPSLFAEAPQVPEAASETVQKPFHVEPIQVQKALTQAGFFTGKIDGIIGKKTRAAVRAFQEANGLKVDGRCGPLTWEKLKQYDVEPVSASPETGVSPAVDAASADIPLIAEETEDIAGYELKQKLVS